MKTTKTHNIVALSHVCRFSCVNYSTTLGSLLQQCSTLQLGPKKKAIQPDRTSYGFLIDTDVSFVFAYIL